MELGMPGHVRYTALSLAFEHPVGRRLVALAAEGAVVREGVGQGAPGGPSSPSRTRRTSRSPGGAAAH